MADYLTNLAARSLGQLPTVMPRRASRFEADAIASGIESIEEVQAEARRPMPASEDRNDAGRRQQEADLLDPATEASHTREAESRQAIPDRSAESLPRSDQRLRARRSSEAPPDIQVEVRRLENVGSSEPGEGGPQLTVKREVIETRPHGDSLAQSGQDQSNPERVPVLPVELHHVVDAVTVHAAAKTERLISERRHVLAPTDPLRVMTHVASPQASAPGPTGPLRVMTHVASPQASTPGPTEASVARITVSIGRIEVKAAKVSQSPVPRPPVERSQPPQISLDAYMDRARRGRR